MNRVIKFRAIIEDELTDYTRIVEVDCIDFFKKEIRYHDDEGVWYRHFLTIESIVQFTGLCDRSGVEIYEGDIVEIECGCGHKDKMPVEWKDNSYRLKQTWSHDFPDGELELCQLSRTKVIGNIYEDKELLDKHEEK